MVNVTLVQSANRYLAITIGPLILLLALIGNGLVIAVFARRTGNFRKSPCSLYFTWTTAIKTLHLAFILPYFIMSIGFGVDPTLTSLVYCKLRYYIAQATLPQIALTLECAATISQFLATSRQAHYRQKNTHKVARICIVLTIFFWSLQAIPALILYKIKFVSVKNKTVCDSFNKGLSIYTTWVLCITTIVICHCTILPLFGYLTLRNVRRLGCNSSQQQKIEQQMSLMLLVQIAFYLFGSIPFGVWNVYTLTTAATIKSPERMAIEGLVNTIIYLLGNATFASSFYLFYATSDTFRKQCKTIFQDIFGYLRESGQVETSPTTVSAT